MSYISARALLAGQLFCYLNGVWDDCSKPRPYARQPVLFGSVHSVIGPRERNEDSAAVVVSHQEVRRGAVVVADGVGGMWGGDVASALAVRLFVENFHRISTAESFTWELHKAVLEELGGRGGTTIAVANIDVGQKVVEVVTVGDSLVYAVKVKGDARVAGHDLAITSEVSYVSDTDREVGTQISQALGIVVNSPHVNKLTLTPCTVYLAATDGVTDVVELGVLAALADAAKNEVLNRRKALGRAMSPEEKYHQFIVTYVKKVLDNAQIYTQDNASVAAMFYTGGVQCF